MKLIVPFTFLVYVVESSRVAIFVFAVINIELSTQ